MDATSNQGPPCVIVISQESVVTPQVDSQREGGRSEEAAADYDANVIVHREGVVRNDNEEAITLLQTQEQEHTYRRLMVVPDDVASGRQSAMSEVRTASPNSMDAMSFTLPNCDNTTEYKEFSQNTLHRYYGDVTPYGTVARGATPIQRETVDGNFDEGTIQSNTSAKARTNSRVESPDPTSRSSASTSVYSTLLRTSRKGTQQVLLGSRNISYVDFIPSKIKRSCGRREYKNFSDCMDQANDWLNESNQQVKLLRCESLRHRLDHSHRVNPESTSSHDRSYVIGLRLWFYQTEAPIDCNNAAQKLVYQNFIPGYKQNDRTTAWKSTDSPFFENLQQTTKRLNEHLLHCPLSGDLLSIESVPVNYKTVFRQKGHLDVDASYCCIEFQGQWDFFFIRMFYLENLTQPRHSALDVKDFVPYPVTFPPSVIEFQSFSSLIAKANRWLESSQSVDIATIQTVEIPFKTKLLELQKGHVKSNSMSYECPRYSVHWDTIRVLRIWFKEDPSRQQLQIPLQQLNYDVKAKMEVRTFFPEQLTMPGCCGTQKPIFATTHDTVKRIDQWIATTGAEIIDIETESFEKWSGRPKRVQNDLTEKCYNKEDFASTFTRSALDYRLTAFRVYYKPNALTSIEDPISPSQPVKPCCCFVGCTIQ